MDRAQLSALLKKHGYQEPIKKIDEADGVQAEWTKDGRLKTLRFVYMGAMFGWSLNDANDQDSAFVTRKEKLSFLEERFCDDAGNPEESYDGWLERWVMEVSRFALGQVSCSFCARSQKEVAKLVSGRLGSFICDECILLLADVVTEDSEAEVDNSV